jgi:hypothetical protein
MLKTCNTHRPENIPQKPEIYLAANEHNGLPVSGIYNRQAIPLFLKDDSLSIAQAICNDSGNTLLEQQFRISSIDKKLYFGELE